MARKSWLGDMENFGGAGNICLLAGKEAHSLEFSEDAYAKAAEPKEFYIIPNEGHGISPVRYSVYYLCGSWNFV